MTAPLILVYLAGVFSPLVVYAVWRIYKRVEDLPPIEGKTVVRRKNARPHYRRLPRKTGSPATEALEVSRSSETS